MPAARRIAVAALGTACLVVGLTAAVRAAWICDDAYISFRYARNLVEGLGLVFNPGERVEGYTNFLWTVWSALALWLGIEPRLWVQAWGVACYGLSIVLLAWNHLTLRDALGISAITLPLGAAIAALHEDWSVYATGGLETSCFTLLGLIGFLLLAGPGGKHAGRPLAAGLVLALATMTRPDGILLVAVGGLFLLWDARSVGRPALRGALRFALGFAALWLPFTFWRLAYYGAFFPNTYYAKSANLFWISQGWIYVRLFFLKYWILLPALPLAWFAALRKPAADPRGDGDPVLRQTVLATGFAIAYVLYVVKVGGDFMFGRFLVPVVPFLAISCDIGLLRLARRRGALQIGAGGLVLAALLAAPQTVAGREVVHGIANEPYQYPRERLDEIDRKAAVLKRFFAGLDVRAAFSGSEARLVYEAGIPRAYECETGLTDPIIAHQKLSERGRVGHEKHATIDFIIRERGAQFAFKTYTLEVLDAGGRIPNSQVLLDEGIRIFVLHWDPELMAELQRRGAVFRDFPTDLSRIIAKLDHVPREEVERIYPMAELFYFDHVDDPVRRHAFEARLRAGD